MKTYSIKYMIVGIALLVITGYVGICLKFSGVSSPNWFDYITIYMPIVSLALVLFGFFYNK